MKNKRLIAGWPGRVGVLIGFTASLASFTAWAQDSNTDQTADESEDLVVVEEVLVHIQQQIR